MSTVTKPRLLIVDDEALVCRSLARAFRRTVEVSTAENASQARFLLGAHAFDVVLSDFDMPQENGAHFLGWVANEFPLVKRVLMTGAEPVDVESLLQAGVVHERLNKPFELEEAARVLGFTSMHLAGLKPLDGAFLSSMADFPLVQVVMRRAPSEAEVHTFIAWQQQLLEVGLAHGLLFIVEPNSGLTLSTAGSVLRWLAPAKSSQSTRMAVAFVAHSRLERVAISAAKTWSNSPKVKTFAAEDLQLAARWLRAAVVQREGVQAASPSL